MIIHDNVNKIKHIKKLISIILFINININQITATNNHINIFKLSIIELCITNT